MQANKVVSKMIEIFGNESFKILFALFLTSRSCNGTDINYKKIGGEGSTIFLLCLMSGTSGGGGVVSQGPNSINEQPLKVLGIIIFVIYPFLEVRIKGDFKL